jgi:hypothetical protein
MVAKAVCALLFWPDELGSLDLGAISQQGRRPTAWLHGVRLLAV